MKKLWYKISQVGIDESISPLELRYISLMNEITILRSLFLFSIAGLMLLYWPYSEIIIIVVVSASMIMMMPLMMNKRKMHTLARVSFSISAFLAIVVLSFMLGEGTLAYLLLLVVIIVTYFIFPPHQSKIMYVLLWVIGLTFFYIELFGIYPIIKVDLPAYAKAELNTVFKLGTLFLIAVFAAYIYRVIIRSEKALEKEREKSENLLLNILPKSIADRLKTNPETIANRINSATILFSDIVGFTDLSSKMGPAELVKMLDDIVKKFDDLTKKYGLEKIKTIGDAYMVAGGVPDPQSNHAHRIALVAMEMQHAVNVYFSKKYNGIQIRIGMHTGTIVAGVIGKNKYTYDLWGDTVNVASRMESNGLPGEIHVSDTTFQLLKEKFYFESRGEIEVKGKGKMQTYLLKERIKKESS